MEDRRQQEAMAHGVALAVKQIGASLERAARRSVDSGARVRKAEEKGMEELRKLEQSLVEARETAREFSASKTRVQGDVNTSAVLKTNLEQRYVCTHARMHACMLRYIYMHIHATQYQHLMYTDMSICTYMRWHGMNTRTYIHRWRSVGDWALVDSAAAAAAAAQQEDPETTATITTAEEDDTEKKANIPAHDTQRGGHQAAGANTNTNAAQQHPRTHHPMPTAKTAKAKANEAKDAWDEVARLENHIRGMSLAADAARQEHAAAIAALESRVSAAVAVSKAHEANVEAAARARLDLASGAVESMREQQARVAVAMRDQIQHVRGDLSTLRTSVEQEVRTLMVSEIETAGKRISEQAHASIMRERVRHAEEEKALLTQLKQRKSGMQALRDEIRRHEDSLIEAHDKCAELGDECDVLRAQIRARETADLVAREEQEEYNRLREFHTSVTAKLTVLATAISASAVAAENRSPACTSGTTTTNDEGDKGIGGDDVHALGPAELIGAAADALARAELRATHAEASRRSMDGSHERDLNSAKAIIDRLEREVHGIRLEKKRVQDERDRAVEECEHLRNASTNKEKDAKAARDARDASDAECERLRRALDEANASIREHRKRGTAASNELASTRASLAAAREAGEGADADREAARVKMASVVQELSSVRKSLAAAQRQVATAREAGEGADAERASMRIELASSSNELTATREQLASVREQLANARTELRRSEEAAATAHRELNFARESSATLQAQLHATLGKLESGLEFAVAREAAVVAAVARIDISVATADGSLRAAIDEERASFCRRIDEMEASLSNLGTSCTELHAEVYANAARLRTELVLREEEVDAAKRRLSDEQRAVTRLEAELRRRDDGVTAVASESVLERLLKHVAVESENALPSSTMSAAATATTTTSTANDARTSSTAFEDDDVLYGNSLDERRYMYGLISERATTTHAAPPPSRSTRTTTTTTTGIGMAKDDADALRRVLEDARQLERDVSLLIER